jgi:hypothetical protein
MRINGNILGNINDIGYIINLTSTVPLTSCPPIISTGKYPTGFNKKKIHVWLYLFRNIVGEEIYK